MEKKKLSDNYSEKQTYETIIFIRLSKEEHAESKQNVGRLHKCFRKYVLKLHFQRSGRVCV